MDRFAVTSSGKDRGANSEETGSKALQKQRFVKGRLCC